MERLNKNERRVRIPKSLGEVDVQLGFADGSEEIMFETTGYLVRTVPPAIPPANGVIASMWFGIDLPKEIGSAWFREKVQPWKSRASVKKQVDSYPKGTCSVLAIQNEHGRVAGYAIDLGYALAFKDGTILFKWTYNKEAK